MVVASLGAVLAVAAPAAAHPGLHPGEAFTYAFSVGPIAGARARMSVGLPVRRDGRSLVAVQGQAETISIVSLVAPVDAAYQVILDAETLLPQEVTSTERGLRERRFHSLIAGRTIDLEIVSPKRNAKVRRTTAREVRDPLSAYFVLRAAALAIGDRFELDVLDGAVIWRASLRVTAHEPVRLGEASDHLGPPQPAIRLDGTLVRIDDAGRAVPRVAPRTLACWLADDPSRALLRAEFDSELGRARMELTSYLPPRRRATTATAAVELPGVVRATPPPR